MTNSCEGEGEGMGNNIARVKGLFNNSMQVYFFTGDNCNFLSVSQSGQESVNLMQHEQAIIQPHTHLFMAGNLMAQQISVKLVE